MEEETEATEAVEEETEAAEVVEEETEAAEVTEEEAEDVLVGEISGIVQAVMVELVPAIPDQEAGLVQFAPTPTFRVSKPKRIILCALHSFHHQNLNSEQSDNFICDQCSVKQPKTCIKKIQWILCLF